MNNLKNKVGVAVNSSRITLKLAIILALILILLIPQQMVRGLIREREGRQAEVTQNIAQQIGDENDIVGPIIAIPYKVWEEKIVFNDKDQKIKQKFETTSYAYFMPENLLIESNVEVTSKHKDIYKVPFFQAENKLHANFTQPNFEKWKSINPSNIKWKEAFLLVGVSDLKGISESPTLNIGGQTIEFEPGGNGSRLLHSMVYAKLPESFATKGGELTVNIPIRGTQALNFASTAKDNQLEMQSNWPHPNFESVNTYAHYAYDVAVDANGAPMARGNTLPTQREIDDQGFTATWKENQFSIDQPSQWLQTIDSPNLTGRLMGARFVNLADQYNKTERSVKYMALIISLVFVAFFIIELLRQTRVHPFQYVLVGSAIAIFFILLLAASEYLGFNLAYLSAAVASTILIGLYSLSVFRSKSMAISVTLLLGALFLFLFVLLIAAHYSLLIGAVGLFIILALIMYVTRDVKWYGLNTAE